MTGAAGGAYSKSSTLMAFSLATLLNTAALNYRIVITRAGKVEIVRK